MWKRSGRVLGREGVGLGRGGGEGGGWGGCFRAVIA